jgi:cyclase
MTAALLAATTGYAGEPIWGGNKVHMLSEKLDQGVVAYSAADARELNAKACC